MTTVPWSDRLLGGQGEGGVLADVERGTLGLIHGHAYVVGAGHSWEKPPKHVHCLCVWTHEEQNDLIQCREIAYSRFCQRIETNNDDNA